MALNETNQIVSLIFLNQWHLFLFSLVILLLLIGFLIVNLIQGRNKIIALLLWYFAMFVALIYYTLLATKPEALDLDKNIVLVMWILFGAIMLISLFNEIFK